MAVDLQMGCKALVCGDTVELIFYSVPIHTDYERTHKINRKEKTIDNDPEKRLDNLYRARGNIRRLIWCNQGKYTKFVTLTYKNTVLDIKKVRRDIQTFVQNMSRKGYEMNYLYVLENQKERGLKENNQGSLHIHMVIFIEKFIPFEDIEKSWNKGFVNIQAIEDIKNLGAYVCKYLTKDNISEFGKRSYSCSLNLKRPQEEKFYTLGITDSGLQIHPEDLLKQMNITYANQKRFDYIDSNGAGGTQTVRYIQGKFKNGNPLDSENDPLKDFIINAEKLGIEIHKKLIISKNNEYFG